MKKTINPQFKSWIDLTSTYSWPLAIFFIALLMQTTRITKMSLLIGIVILFILNLKNKAITFPQASKIFAILTLHLMASLSYFWSFVPYQTMITVMNDIEIFFISYLIVQYSLNKNIAATFKLSAIVIITYIACYSILFYGESMSAIGLKASYIHKNSLAPVLVICLFILFYASIRNKIDLLFIALGFVLLVLTQSKTSISLFITIVLIISLIQLGKYFFNRLSNYSQGFIKLCLKTIPIILYILIINLVIFREAFSSYLLKTFTNEMLTGRGELWLTVLARSKEHLLLGIGPGAFWGSGGAERLSEIAQTSLYLNEWITRLKAADGGYIDVIGALGFIGLALLLISFVQIYKLIALHATDPFAKLAFACVTFIALHNITESDVFRFLNAPWFLYLFFMFYLAMRTISSRTLKQTSTRLTTR